MSDRQDIENTTPPAHPSLPRMGGAIASLAWAALGPVFAAESSHFGPGFGPGLLWLASIPVIALVLFGATVYKVNTYLEGGYGARASRIAVGVWPLASLVYLAIGLYLLIT